MKALCQWEVKGNVFLSYLPRVDVKVTNGPVLNVNAAAAEGAPK